MEISRAFDTTGPVELDVRNASGDVQVTATDTNQAVVEIESDREDVERCRIEFRGNRLVVHAPDRNRGFALFSIRLGGGYDMRITVPTGSSVRSSCASADLRVTGRIATVEAHTASGEIRVGDVDGDARIKTASGDVALGSVTGMVRSGGASGDLTVDCAESVEATTASGDVTVNELGDSAWIKTASGEITIRRAGQGRVEATSASGGVWIGVAAGAIAKLALRSVSGSVNSALPIEDDTPEDGPTVEIRATTVSGGVTIARAPAAHPTPSE